MYLMLSMPRIHGPDPNGKLLKSSHKGVIINCSRGVSTNLKIVCTQKAKSQLTNEN